MQIKFFKGTNILKIEKEVNEFIKDKEVTDIKQSVCTKEGWTYSEMTVMVMYKEH